MNTDHNLWKIIQNGNSKKILGRDSKGGIIILPPVSFKEHVAVQRETKAKTLLLQSLPEDHMADFHHLDDAREIWLAVKARFGGNEESKRMRKTMLKQAFSEFSVSKEEGLHKGYDRFQKILSQLNQMQAKPDNDDVNIKFLRALPSSWSQVALTLKTRGGLEYLSFNDLYNKLRSLEINVKGGSNYGSRSTIVAPTHSAFIGAASTNTKMVYSDQLSHSSLISYTFVSSGGSTGDGKIRHQMEDGYAFTKDQQLGHFARECNVKKVDEKARYFTFKISEVKTEEPKDMVSVDSMLKWNEHEAKNKTDEAEQVYGLMAVFESDFAVHAGNAAGSVNPAAAEFAMMGISPKVQTRPFGCDSQLSALKKHYDHLEKLYNDSFIQVQAYKNTAKTLEHQKDWYHKIQLALEEKVRILSANLENTTNILKYSKTLYTQAKIEKKEWEVKFIDSLDRTKLSLGFKEYIRSDKVCDLSTPSSFDSKPENREVKSLCQSDKSSASKTYDFTSYVSSPKTNDSFSTVDVKIFPKSDVKDPSPTNGFPSCSFKENVKPTRNLSSVPASSRNSSASTSADRSIPAASRNRSATIHADRSTLAASRNRPASIHAGRINKPTHFPAGRSVPTDLICNGGPRTMVDLINLHGFVLNDPQGRLNGCSRSMTGNKEKLDDFVQVKGGTVTFGGGDVSCGLLLYFVSNVSGYPKLLVGGDLTMAEQLVGFIKAALLNAKSAV
uniref:Xylulose kinase-1 n=1 Tax=Tanacetum cinerariifolium TaxID=118510 RepID=A0A6L2MR49_TANCI|nr:xylulose kinase-1 [Tanacetum cinerariifolium]